MTYSFPRALWCAAVCGCSVAVADPGPSVPLGGERVLRFAAAEEGAAVLGAEDEFTRRLSPYDRQARVRVARPVEDAEYRAFAARAPLDWTAAETRRIRAALDGLAGRLALLPLPEEVLLVKTTGDEEGGAAYTRGGAVMLPRAVLASPPAALRRLLCHELFHVASRHDPVLRGALYAAIGFEPCGEVALPGDLESRRLTNPDAPTADHCIRVTLEGVERRMVPVLYSRTAEYDAAAGRPFFATMEFRLLAIDLAGDPPRGVAVLDGDGRPILAKPEEVAGFFEQAGRNTSYLIHPEEILADNVALALAGRGDPAPRGSVPSPDVLARIEGVIRRHAGLRERSPAAE